MTFCYYDMQTKAIGCTMKMFDCVIVWSFDIVITAAFYVEL